ncbi:hypothetical protein CNR22_09065 [Sphingobacteriaceae bacterium]|nr:hypothetical protein CNR22_09065 [Sphingobacteriaceae bacterium]
MRPAPALSPLAPITVDMRTIKDIFVLFALFALTSCDPALDGDIKVFNETNQTLRITYNNGPYNSVDTIIQDILPNDNLLVNSFGGLGNKKTFDCCPDRTQIFYISSALGVIKKDHNSCTNWKIPNKSKLKKHGKESIKCEFHVTQEDL